MITKALSDFTSPIVDKALETGARGSTSVTTNYGVIGDAFFKKANLELGIAELQANMGMEAARLKSGLEMDKARLMLQANEFKINTDLQAFQLEQEAAADQSSPMDVILGAVGGAAQGAAAGAAFGPKGALIGGIAGGALTGLSYAQGGKRTGDRALQTVGMVANATSVIKGYSDQRKSADTWTGLMGTARDIMGMMQNSDPSIAAAGREQWAMFQTEAHKVMSPYMNPEQIDSALAGLNDFASKSTPSQSEMDRGRMFQKVVDFESDPRWTSGSAAEQEDALNEFLDEMDIEYAIQNAGDVMPPDLQMAWAEKLGKSVGVKGLGEMVYNQYADDEAIETTSTKQKVSTPQKVSPKKGGSIQGTAPTPSLDVGQERERALPQPTQQQSRPAPEQRTSGIPFRLPEGNGVEMDDGMDIFTKPVQAEMELQKLGEKSAEVYREKEEMESMQGEQEPLSIKEKIEHNRSLSEDEFAERKIPLWEKDVPRNDPRLKAPAGTKTKERPMAEAYQANNIESATAVREEVDTLLDQTDVSGDKIAERRKTGMRDAMYSLEQLEEAASELPDGYFNELAMRAHAEGLKTTDYATVIAVVGTGVKGKALVGALRKAGGASALKAAGAMGILGLAENATGTLSKIDADLIQPITKGKGYFLSDKEQQAISKFASASRAFVQSQYMGETGETKMSEQTIVAEMKSFLSFSDSKEERWRKIAGGIDEIRDSARSFHRNYQSGGGGSTKKSGGKSAAPRPGTPAWRAEQEAKLEWEMEKKAIKDSGNFKLIRPGRRYGR